LGWASPLLAPRAVQIRRSRDLWCALQAAGFRRAPVQIKKLTQMRFDATARAGDGLLLGPGSERARLGEKRAPRVGISSTVFGVLTPATEPTTIATTAPALSTPVTTACAQGGNTVKGFKGPIEGFKDSKGFKNSSNDLRTYPKWLKLRQECSFDCFDHAGEEDDEPPRLLRR